MTTSSYSASWGALLDDPQRFADQLLVCRQTGSNSRFQLVGIALLVIQGIPEIA
jgi:hypothetical protein